MHESRRREPTTAGGENNVLLTGNGPRGAARIGRAGCGNRDSRSIRAIERVWRRTADCNNLVAAGIVGTRHRWRLDAGLVQWTGNSGGEAAVRGRWGNAGSAR